MATKIQWSIAAVTLLGWSASIQALEPINVGGLMVTPSLGLSFSADDNLRSDAAAESGNVATVSPGLSVGFGQGNATGSVNYGVTHRRFSSFSGEDTTDYNLGGVTSLTFNPRNALDLRANWNTSESNASAGQPIDDFVNTGFGAVYRFGAAQALLNADLGWGLNRRRSDNASNLDKENDVTTLTGTGYVRISPRTQLLFELRQIQAEYDAAPLKNNDRMAYLAGARWQATAFTSGAVRVGYEEQSFDEPGKSDENSFVWEVGVTWQPRSFTTLELSTGQSLEDGDSGARSNIQTRYGLNWNLDWAGPVSTSFGVARTNDDYDNARDDDNTTFSAELGVQLARSANVGVRYSYTDKGSTLPDEKYDRERIGVFLDLGLSL